MFLSVKGISHRAFLNFKKTVERHPIDPLSSRLFSLSFFHMPYSPSFIPSYLNTTPTLGVSVLVCTVIAYTLAKMFGFGRRNEFPVEGRVSGMILSLGGIWGHCN